MNRAERIKKGCTDKAQFEKEWKARREAKRCGHRVYQCLYCHKFHLTSS